MKAKRTRFKTIIIPKKIIKNIIKFIAVIALISIFSGILKLFSHANEQIAVSDRFYKSAISAQLHNEGDKASIKDIILSVIGFDISDAKSIIGEYTNIDADKDEVQEAPTPAAPEPAPEPAPTEEARLPIEEKKSIGNMKISNRTSISVDPNKLSSEPLSFKIEKTDRPQILILHTHTTESFTDNGEDTYTASTSDRSLDESKNIVAVGNIIADTLNNAGIMIKILNQKIISLKE